MALRYSFSASFNLPNCLDIIARLKYAKGSLGWREIASLIRTLASFNFPCLSKIFPKLK